MFKKFLTRLKLDHIDKDLIDLAFVNGLSSMALNGAGIFGLLAVLSGSGFPHGLQGLAIYIALSALATSIGYIGIGRYAASLGLHVRAALYLVFAVHALGFLGAAFIHPLCLAVSGGAGLGIFFVIFMLKSLHGVDDKARDGYATINGLVQQSANLATPMLGAFLLFIGTKLSFHNPFLLTFLTYTLCTVAAIPLIKRIPDAPLPYSISLPLKGILARRHLPAVSLFLTTIACESLMGPISVLSSFALLGEAVEVGWFSAGITVMASASLFLSHHMRLPGRRWMIFGGSLICIGLGYAGFAWQFNFVALVVAAAIYALCRVNYFASWFAVSSKIMSHEWAEFGRNQALVLAEMFVVTARLSVAGLVLSCAIIGLSLKESLDILIGFFLLCSVASLLLACHLELRAKPTQEV